MSHRTTSHYLFQFLIVTAITLQASCNSVPSPSIGPVQTEGSFTKVSMPMGGLGCCFYKKDNPHKLFLSQKDEYGPGLMLDLDTGAQEWVADRDPDPGGHMVIPGESEEDSKKRDYKYMPMPGESREAFLKREEASRPKPIATDELFESAGMASVKSPYSRSEGYYIDLQGDYTKIQGEAPKGFPFQTGTRKTEDTLFTGDLILTVRDKVLLRQHFKNVPSMIPHVRTHQALKVGLVLYYDGRPDGTGTLYVFQVPLSGSSSPENSQQGQSIIVNPRAQTPPPSVSK